MSQKALLAFTVLTVCAVYLFPIIPLAHSGTYYILIHALLTGAMFMVWKTDSINIKHVLFVGILLRLILIPAPMFSSNDSERYLWDGALVLAGLDPYTISPNMAEAAELRKIWSTPEEHSAYATLYPPGALILFAISALAGPVKGVWLWKALASLASVASLLIGYDLLKRRHLLPHLPLLALSPLLILETGIGAHLDAFCVLSVVGVLALCDREKFIFAGIIIGWSASIKFLPAIMAGPLLFYVRPQAALKILLSSIFTLIIIYAAALLSGFQAIGILPTFFEKWRNGAPFYNLLDYIFNPPYLLGVIGLVALGLFSLSAFKAHQRHIILAIMLTFTVPLVLSPVVFPWYLSVLVPLAALQPSAAILGWVSAAPLSYIVLNKWLSEGLWHPPSWPLWIMAFVIIGGVIYDISKPKPSAMKTLK